MLSILSVFPLFIYSKLLLKEMNVNKDLMQKMVRGFQFSFFLSAAFLILQLIVGLKITFYPDLNPNVNTSDGIRYPGFFGDAQVNALFLGMTSFMFLINFKNIKKPTLLNFCLFTVVLVALFISGGKSAFLGLCIGLVFLWLFFSWRVKNFIGIAALIGLAMIPFLKNSFVLFQRLGSLDESYEFRSYIWKEAYDIYDQHQLLGIGLGNYKDYVERYSADQYYVLEDGSILILDQPENGYLKVLTEAGIIGSVIALLFLIMPIGRALYSHLVVRKNYIALLFIAPVVCWLVSFYSLYTLSDRRIELLLASLICFLIASIYERSESIKANPETTLKLA
ncbi:MAG TPA: O-antigen ligase family protein [Puia sp.]|nr:O-antigen ligase family protein [Puia sp.]